VSALSGQAALVTGAGSGIGRAIAVALAGAGADVGLVGRTVERLEETAGLVRAAGGKVRVHAVDLTDADRVSDLSAEVSAAGALDVLVHAAGTLSYGEVGTTPVAELDGQYAIHVRAPYVLTQGVLPLLRARQGQIVFVNSTVVVAPPGRVSQYAAAKAGQQALADSLRAEVNPEGIRVLSIFPGRTATPMQEALRAEEGRSYHADDYAQPADVAAMVLAALTLPRSAEVTDISLRPMRPPR